MGIHRSNIEVYFRRALPRDAFEGLLLIHSSPAAHDNRALADDSINRGIALTFDNGAPPERYKLYAREISPTYTDAELDLHLMRASEYMRKIDGNVPHETSASVFNLVLGYAQHVVRMDMGEPQCRYKYLLGWQELTQTVGQDMFTCALYAYYTLTGSRIPSNLAWNFVIATDNLRLRRLFEEEDGIAENHFHLWNSANTFDMTWTMLMNRYRDIGGIIGSWFQEYLGGGQSDWFPEQSGWELWLKRAAIIRADLFTSMVSPTHHGAFRHRKGVHGDVMFYLRNTEYIGTVGGIDSVIGCLRYEHGAIFPEYGSLLNGAGVFDYALTVDEGVRNSSLRSLVGERRFLVNCFRNVFSGDTQFTREQKQMFYLYLLIKTRFRGEFVQLNNRRGFDNFKRIQDRRHPPGETYPFSHEMAHFAINATLETQNIGSLELRVTPRSDPRQCVSQLNSIIKAERAPRENAERNLMIGNWRRQEPHDIRSPGSVAHTV